MESQIQTEILRICVNSRCVFPLGAATDTGRVRFAALLPRIAILCAGFIFVSSVASGFLSNPLIIPLALIPLTAAILIARRRVWGAYGFALYLASQSLIILLVSTRSEESTHLLPAGLLNLGLFFLFALTGRTLEQSGAPRGLILPWVIITATLSVPLLFIEPFVIPSGAMEDTLLIGDHVLVERFPRPIPKLGDIVVFRYRGAAGREVFAKRVMGVPGDRIRLVAGTVYRNGKPLHEAYVTYKFGKADPYGRDFPASTPGPQLDPRARTMLAQNVQQGDVVVPPGKYFVLGDNRDASLDSRYIGFVSAGDLIGKFIGIYESVAPQPDGQSHRSALSRTRWSRTGKLF